MKVKTLIKLLELENPESDVYLQKDCDIEGIKNDTVLWEILSRNTKIPRCKTLRLLNKYGRFFNSDLYQNLFYCEDFPFIIKRMWTAYKTTYSKIKKYVVPTYFLTDYIKPNFGGYYIWVLQPLVDLTISDKRYEIFERKMYFLFRDKIDLKMRNAGIYKNKVLLHDW